MSIFRDTRNKIISWLANDRPPRHQYLSDFNVLKDKIKLGDVLLVEGRSRISQVIKTITKSPWSHAALYIGHISDIADPHHQQLVKNFVADKVSEDQQLVIEALLGRGVVITTLEYYYQDHLRICRPSGITEKDCQHVINYAIDNLGKPYNTRQVFDLLRFLLPIKILPRHWRSSLFRYKEGTITEEMCSSMIANAFESVNFPILPLITKDRKNNYAFIKRNPLLYTPSDFDYSPFFDIIKYPICGVYKDGVYENLPWKEGVMSNDEKLVRINKQKDDSANP